MRVQRQRVEKCSVYPGPGHVARRAQVGGGGAQRHSGWGGALARLQRRQHAAPARAPARSRSTCRVHHLTPTCQYKRYIVRLRDIIKYFINLSPHWKIYPNMSAKRSRIGVMTAAAGG